MELQKAVVRLLCLLGANDLYHLVLKGLLAVVVEKYLGDKGLSLLLRCQNTVRLSWCGLLIVGLYFGIICHLSPPFD